MLEPVVIGDERFEVVSQLERRGEVDGVQGSKFVWFQAAAARRTRSSAASAE